MDRLKRTLSLLCALSILTALAGCQAASQPVNQSEPPAQPWESAELFLSYATSQGSSGDTSSTLTQELLDCSQGRIYCNTYTSGQMGNDQDLMAAVRTGALSIIQLATSVQVEQIPELALLDIPYLFSDVDRCNEQLSGALLDFFQPYYNREGLQLLCWNCPSFRTLSSSFPVETKEDLTKLTLRTLNNPYHQLYWSAVGAQPQTLPFSRLFYAVQQGVVNSQENTPNAVVSIRLQQIQPYILLTNHLPFINTAVMNKEIYDSLSPQDQQLVTQVLTQHCNSIAPAYSQEELETYFPHVLTPSETLWSHLYSGVPVVEEALREDLGEELIQSFYAALYENTP